MPDNDIPIPERIGGIPCERCKHMIISDTAYNFLKSYSYGYITDEEATAVIMEEARRMRLHYECAEILVKNALNTFKPKEKKKNKRSVIDMINKRKIQHENQQKEIHSSPRQQNESSDGFKEFSYVEKRKELDSPGIN